MTVYLAGPINGTSDQEAYGWRDLVRGYGLDVTIFDPMVRDYRGKEHESISVIVEGDKADIDQCDVVLAYCWQPSYGTAMELLYAWERGKRVIAVVPTGQPVSPWVAYHAEVVSTIEQALELIRGQGL